MSDVDLGPATPPLPAERPWVVAHRGASGDLPENTLAAFTEALIQGADAIELDVQLSRDDVPVVYHDRTLAHAGGGRRRVSELDLATLRALPARELPTLDEVLERIGRRTVLLVEIKSRPQDAGRRRAVAQRALDLVRRRGLERRVWILCFDVGVLEACATVAPAVPRAINLDRPEPGAWGPDGLVQAVSANVAALTPAFGAAAREAGLPLFAYTCNTERRVERALRAGAAAVMSDHPGWLARVLDARRGAVAT